MLMLAFNDTCSKLSIMGQLLTREQIGTELTGAIEAAQTTGATSGELAVTGAKLLLGQLLDYGDGDSAEQMLTKLKGAGMDEVRKDLATSAGYEEWHLRYLDYRYTSPLRWDVTADVTNDYEDDWDNDEEPVSRRQAIIDFSFDRTESVMALYREEFETTLELFIADSPDLAGHMDSLDFPDDERDRARRFTRDLVEVLTDEEQYDAALLASRYAPSVKDIERRLLVAARAGHKPSIAEAHRRFMAEDIYARKSYYAEGDDGELQYSWEFFEAALAAGMLDLAADMVNKVTNISQLEAILLRAVPKLMELNHIEIPDPLTLAELHDFTDRLMSGIVNDFDMTSTKHAYDIEKLRDNWDRASWDKNWKEANRSAVESRLFFSLGIELSYNGQVEDATRVATALRDVNQSAAVELKRFIAAGHFIASDVDDAIEHYKHFREEWYSADDMWVTRHAVVELAKRGAVAESLLMASRYYDSTDFGKHAGYLLALSVAASHGVFEK